MRLMKNKSDNNRKWNRLSASLRQLDDHKGLKHLFCSFF